MKQHVKRKPRLPTGTLLPLLFGSFLLTSTDTSAQKTGRVITPTGQPIASATIDARGSFYITDSSGAFSVRFTADSAFIKISSIGFTGRSLWLYHNKPFAELVLQPDLSELKEVEVVSTGYQDIPRQRSTGSFAKVDNETLNRQVGTNILRRLDGVASGLMFNIGKQNLNPQNSTDITIRGLSTINGPLDPLVVVDGFIYEGDINNINPNDVDNVTILKDASAASIWGARAGNGVIVINTRRPKAGQPARWDISTNFTLSQEPDLHRLPVMSSADYIGAETMLFNNGYFDAQINGSPLRPLTPGLEALLAAREGRISQQEADTRLAYLSAIDGRNEYLKHFYQPSATTQLSASLSGSSTANSYRFGVAYDYLDGSHYERQGKLNLSLSETYRFSKRLQLDIAAYYTNSSNRPGRGIEYGNGAVAGMRAYPYIQFADALGNALPLELNYKKTYTDTAGGGLLQPWDYYPLTNYQYIDAKNNREELLARIGLKYKAARWLDIELQYQHQNQKTESRSLAGKESYTARDLVNTFAQVNQASGTVNYIIRPGGILTTSNNKLSSYTARGQLHAHHSWKSHQLNLTSGIEARESAGEGNGTTIYGYQEDPLSFQVTDFVNQYPTYVYGSATSIPGAPVEYKKTVNRFISTYAVGGYTWRNKYTLNASARRDGSNVFGAATNDRWRPLWSAGLSWKLSAEPFFNVPWVSNLLLRASYGKSGNVDLSKTAEAVAQYFGSAPVSALPYTRVGTPNNPELKWEQSAIFNIAADFSLLKGRLNGTLEFYLKKGTDLYGPGAYDYTGWGGSRDIVSNLAATKGQGVDLNIQARLLAAGSFRWNAGLLLSWNKSQTTAYNSVAGTSLAAMLGSGAGISPFIGKPQYAIALYEWAGLDGEGNPQGYVDGKPSTDYQAIINEANEKGLDGNIAYIGAASPQWFGSLTNSLSFRGWNLSCMLAYRGGYHGLDGGIYYSILASQGLGHSEFADRWQQPGDEARTHVPSFTYPLNELRDYFYTNSEVKAFRADNIRLQYVSLSYDLYIGKGNRKKLFKPYLNLANAGIVWKKDGHVEDPDYPGVIRPAAAWSAGFRTTL
jgi:TonB-linked SusC/RagA family outer membrane protein